VPRGAAFRAVDRPARAQFGGRSVDLCWLAQLALAALIVFWIAFVVHTARSALLH
jgi:hypothetical protein